MFVDKNSVKINNISMGQYLTQVDYEYNKLWASDSGRNLAGKQTGTLIGIFPKLVMYFRKLTAEELHIIAPILDSARQSVTYYDDNKGMNVTMNTYTGDWKVTSKSIGKADGFQCSFISVEKRS